MSRTSFRKRTSVASAAAGVEDASVACSCGIAGQQQDSPARRHRTRGAFGDRVVGVGGGEGNTGVRIPDIRQQSRTDGRPQGQTASGADAFPHPAKVVSDASWTARATRRRRHRAAVRTWREGVLRHPASTWSACVSDHAVTLLHRRGEPGRSRVRDADAARTLGDFEAASTARTHRWRGIGWEIFKRGWRRRA